MIKLSRVKLCSINNQCTKSVRCNQKFAILSLRQDSTNKEKRIIVLQVLSMNENISRFVQYKTQYLKGRDCMTMCECSLSAL